jgi:hypothetical protein
MNFERALLDGGLLRHDDILQCACGPVQPAQFRSTVFTRLLRRAQSWDKKKQNSRKVASH